MDNELGLMVERTIAYRPVSGPKNSSASPVASAKSLKSPFRAR